MEKLIQKIDLSLTLDESREDGEVTAITFPDKLGERALFYIDDFMLTDEKELVFLVTGRTLNILGRLGVKHKICD